MPAEKADIFGQRFFSNRVPAWHRLGYVSQTDMSGVDALTAIGGGYWFEKRKYKEFLNGKWVESNDWRIVRSPLPDDPEERPMGNATDRYTLLQPLEIVELFDEKVGKPVETLGFLTKDGRRMFLTWAMPTFDVTKNDTVELYGFLAIGFDTFMGASLSTVGTRTVCANTFRKARAESARTKDGKGKGLIWSGKHTDKNLKGDLAEWMGYVSEKSEEEAGLMKSFFKRLAKTPLQEENEVYKLLFAAYPNPEPLPTDAFIPPSKRLGKEEKIEEEKQLMTQYRDGIANLFFNKGTAITPDMWGLFNSTTEYFNFAQMEKKDAAASILVGQRNKRMNQMAEVLAYESGYSKPVSPKVQIYTK
jgi:hypothetical protein